MLVRKGGDWVIGDLKLKNAGMWIKPTSIKTKVGSNWVETLIGTLHITQLSDLLSNTADWQYDQTVGWYRNVYSWQHAIDVKFTPELLARIKKISATFTSYNNSPSGGLGENYFTIQMRHTNGSVNSVPLGTSDGNTLAASGQSIFMGDQGSISPTTMDVVNQRYTYTVPEGWTVERIVARSNGYTDGYFYYPFTTRGMKDFEFVLGY